MKTRTSPAHTRHRQRLRAKYMRDGHVLCDHELLETFLFGIVPRCNTNNMAHALIDRFGSLLGVFAADKTELMKTSGVGVSIASYIKATYTEYCGKMHSALMCGKTVTAVQIRNFLIWHRINVTECRGCETYFTVIVLDEDMSAVDIYDTDSISDALENEKARGTCSVIVGVGDVSDDVCKTLCKDSFIRDVIQVKGTDVKSLREENG